MKDLSHKAKTRQYILHEAARGMREVGAEGIGVATLMKRVGLNRGGFYTHFLSRGERVEKVLKQVIAQSAEFIMQKQRASVAL